MRDKIYRITGWFVVAGLFVFGSACVYLKINPNYNMVYCGDDHSYAASYDECNGVDAEIE